MKSKENATIGNIYRLNGRVPLLKAIPFGLQHVLAMFVSNLTPITMIGLASGLSGKELAVLLQNAMFVAGIATLIPAVSGMESRCKTADRYGGKFYLCDHLELRGWNLWISDADRCRFGRWCL